jgi:signal transduction histidine kinase
VRCEVADNGPGVPVAERGALFTEHARLSNRPTAGEESTGLGLSIVKQLIESDGGRVGADFPPEGGSVFWFELPVAPGP